MCTKREVQISTRYEHAANNIRSSMQVGPQLNVATVRVEQGEAGASALTPSGGFRKQAE